MSQPCNPFAGAIGVDSHLEPTPGAHTAHPDTDMKVKEQKTSDASPSAQAMAAVQPPKPNHEIAASVGAAAHGQSRSFCQMAPLLRLSLSLHSVSNANQEV